MCWCGRSRRASTCAYGNSRAERVTRVSYLATDRRLLTVGSGLSRSQSNAVRPYHTALYLYHLHDTCLEFCRERASTGQRADITEEQCCSACSFARDATSSAFAAGTAVQKSAGQVGSGGNGVVVPGGPVGSS